MFSLEDNQTESQALSLNDEGNKFVPPEPIIDVRAGKADYALAEKSPGVDAIKTNIRSGDEDGFRAKVAADEDIQNEKARQALIAAIASKKGSALTESDMQIVRSLSSAQLRTDPGTVLEKKFADKYIQDVMSIPGATWETGFAPYVAKETDIASSILSNKEYYQNRQHDLEAEWSQTGWIAGIPDMIGQMVPFLPWWRQKHSLEQRQGIEFLPGTTMKENVQYLWALPPDQRRAQYDKAIDYLKGKNITMAIDFAKAMTAFPTSDEYLADSMGIADYFTLGGVVGKVGAKLLGRKATEAAVEAAKDTRPTWSAPELTDVTPLTKQLDLFGEQPAQGSFRFMGQRAEQNAPSVESKLPPGKLRGTHVPLDEQAANADRYPTRDLNTGRMVGRPQQLDLPMRAPEHQPSFDLGAPMSPSLKEDLAAPKEIMPIRKALADAVKATEGTAPQVDQVLSAVGDTERAGFLGALKRLKDPVGQGTIDLAREVPTFANPAGFFQSSKVLGRERAQRMAAAMLQQGEGFIKSLVDAVRVNRLTDEALSIAKTNAETKLRTEYAPRAQNGLLDIEHIPAEMHPASVDTTIAWLGKHDANLFKSPDEANVWAKDVYKLGPDEYNIVQQGNSWKIGVSRTLNETDDMVRDAMVVPKNITPGGIINMLTNRIRSTEDLLSVFQRENRKIATHAPQEVRASLRQAIETDIDRALNRKEKRELEDILRVNRDMPSQRYPGERGEWYNTAAELEQAFVDRHGHLPSADQLKAYDTFRRVSDFDWLTRNLSVYRDKARHGIEQFRLVLKDESGQTSRTSYFEGKELPTFPWELKGDQDAGVWVYDGRNASGRFFYKFDMTAAERKEIDRLVSEEGFRIVQTFDPKKHALGDVAKTRLGEPVKDQINFVITNTYERSPLSWQQVDYRPGGHVIYPGQWYVASPVIQTGRGGKLTYFGDNNILNVETQAEAKKWADRLDHVRTLLRAGREEDVEAYRAANLPYSKEELYRLFFGGNAPLSLEHPGGLQTGW
jgi:hypothetical protein